jgi:hypothetical protein
MDNPETLPTLGTRETGRNNDLYCNYTILSILYKYKYYLIFINNYEYTNKKVYFTESLLYDRGMNQQEKQPFQLYHDMTVSFIGGGNQSYMIRPPTCRKSLQALPHNVVSPDTD